MRKPAIVAALAALLLTQAFSTDTEAFYQGPPEAKPRLFPRLLPKMGLGTAIVGGTIAAGGAVIIYMQLCSSSPDCLRYEEEAKEAERQFVDAQQEMTSCSASSSCSQSRMDAIEARAGRARERRKEAKAKARLAAISKARLSPNKGPPGFCEDDVYSTLDAGVDNACKTVSMRCIGTMTAVEVERRRALNVTCAEARDRINFQCFKGGDQTHKDAAASAWLAVKNCDEDLWNLKRKGL